MSAMLPAFMRIDARTGQALVRKVPRQDSAAKKKARGARCRGPSQFQEF
jgi:hypothetical protein